MRVHSVLLLGFCAVLCAGMAGLWVLPWALPATDCTPPPPGAVYDRNGELLGFVRGKDLYREEPLAAGELPPHLVRAVLVAEDKRFLQHVGFDPLATGRALYTRLCGTSHSGASTISMQLVKISSERRPRTLLTKLRELLAARRLEMEHDKEEILRAYLNRADFGNMCRGAETAARFYFNCAAADLTLPQAALLAGVLQAPTRLNPLRNPEAARKRRDYILRRLGEPTDVPLGLCPMTEALPLHVAAQGGGMLSMDASLQRACAAIAREELGKLRSRNVQQAAVMVLRNRTGEVLVNIPAAFPESPQGGQINGTATPRSAGSTLKPFVYLQAFQHGAWPGMVMADVPTLYPDADGIAAPHNYNHRYMGPISIRQALACSQNVPAMEALNSYGGITPFLKLMRDFGFTPTGDSREYGLGLAIGNAHVTLSELARAYATLARRGNRPNLYYYLPSPNDASAATPQVAEPRLCYLITDILSDSSARAATFGAGQYLRFPFPCAAKTGTSSDFRDNWCIGYSQEHTVAVWVGNFDNTRMLNVSGISGAGPIFHRVMQEVHAWENKEHTVHHRQDNDGMPSAPPSLRELFQAERESAKSPQPRAVKRFAHIPSGLLEHDFDTRTGLPATEQTPADFRCRELIQAELLPLLEAQAAADHAYDAEGRAILDARYAEWFPKHGNQNAYSLDCSRSGNRRPMVLIPAHGARLMLDSSLPNDGRVVELKSTLAPDHAQWESPSLRVYQDGSRWFVILRPGTHSVRVRDTRTGISADAFFHVTRLR